MTKLAVVDTVKEAYEGAFRHGQEMIACVWIPAAIYVTISIISAYASYTESFGLVFLLSILTIPLWPMIAVAWHRFVLLGAKPEGSGFQFGQRELRFLIYSVLIGLVMAPGYICYGLAGAFDPVAAQEITPADSGLILLGTALILVGAFFAIRLSLVLPAIAVDQQPDFKAALDVTKGNFWRIFGAFLLATIPVYVVLLIVSVIMNISLIVGAAAVAVIAIFMAIINVAVLSIIFRELSGFRPGGAVPMPGAPDQPAEPLQ